jgi:hypothetical protein
MPLYDIFHRPLSDVHHWQSLHNLWSGSIVADLNRRLPRRFLAEAPMSLGPFASADVSENELLTGPESANGPTGNGGVGLAVEIYAPPAVTGTMPASFPPEYRVEIKDTHRAMRVLAVIELVSPVNKDTEEHREVFAGKCLSYLGKGIGLVVVDTVTDRLANLHNEIVRLAGHGTAFEMAESPSIYAAAYRPAHRKSEDLIDLWTWELVVGHPLPVVPLALKGVGCVRLDLEATYAEACERSHIP